MEAKQTPNFVLLPGEESLFLINIDQIRLIIPLKDGRVRVEFSPDHIMTIGGNGAAELLSFIGQMTVGLDGTSLAEMFKDIPQV